MSTKPIVVIGGGISGLSAAYYLHNSGKCLIKNKSLILLEASKRFGGWIESVRHEDGVIYDTGPRSFRFAGKAGHNTLLLADKIGLTDEIIGVPIKSPASQKRLIFANNQLHVLPSGIDLFKKKPPLSKRLIKYILNDIMTPKLKLIDDDISVDEFMKRRFGSEVAHFIADPLCRGISAGDSKKLSFKSMFPQAFKGERNRGSVIRGLLSSTAADVEEVYSMKDSPIFRKAVAEKWSVWSLRLGTQSLVDQLTSYLLNAGDSLKIYNDSKVKMINFNEDGSSKLEIDTPNGVVDIDASHLFSAIPAHSLAKCLRGDNFNKLRSYLQSIETVHTVVVNLEYVGKNRIKEPAFGFLTPSTEKLPILGIVYDSCSFPEHDGDNKVTRITCMMGGMDFDEVFGSVDDLDKERCFHTAVEAVAKCLEIKENPYRFNVSIHKNCIPQYHVGHSQLLNDIDAELSSTKVNLNLLGASFRGISVNECIYNSKQCVSEFLSENESREMTEENRTN